MDKKYLKFALIGLGNSLDRIEGKPGPTKWFAGHWPCALIAAYYFCKENKISNEVKIKIESEIIKLQGKFSDLFKEDDLTGHHINKDYTIEDLIISLEKSINYYMVSGHNVIYAAYAVKVLKDYPEMASPTLMVRLHALIEYFSTRTNEPDSNLYFENGHFLTKPYHNINDMLHTVYSTLEKSQYIQEKNWLCYDGHLLTHAHALFMLDKMNFKKVAQIGLKSHRIHLEKTLSKKTSDYSQKDYKPVSFAHPFTHEFWDRNFEEFDRLWEFGHVFKYLYSFYDILNRSKIAINRQECEKKLLYLI